MKTVSQGIFEANFEIFGCSEPLVVRLDFNKRTLETETPRLEVEQKPGAKSAISWVTKQIKPSTGFEPLIRLWWPNKKILANLLSANMKRLPVNSHYRESFSNLHPLAFNYNLQC